MIPGFGSTGDSVYGHHLDFLNERVQPIIDFISEYLKTLGQEGEAITSEDKDGLRFCASFADGLDGTVPGKEEGFLTYLEYLDATPPGLDDRSIFETARGYIYSSLPHKAIEVRKPTNERSETLKEERKMKMDSNREEWIKTNPEKVKEILGLKSQEEGLSRIESLLQSLPAMIGTMVEEEIKKRSVPPQASIEIKPGPVKEAVSSISLPPLHLEYHAKPRYWTVNTNRRTNTPDIEAGIIYPDGPLSDLSLSILITDEDSKVNVASVEYKVKVLNLEAYEILYNRLKFVISEFLDAERDGDLVTGFLIREPNDSSLWAPITKDGGRPFRVASVVEADMMKGDGILEVRVGNSYFRMGISIAAKEDITRFTEDISRIVELVLRTAEVLNPPREKA